MPRLLSKRRIYDGGNGMSFTLSYSTCHKVVAKDVGEEITNVRYFQCI